MRAPFTDRKLDDSEIPATVLSAANRPTAAVINLGALEHNFNEVDRRTAGRKILAVVKAQAYGHGAAAVSRRLLELGVAMLGVALVEEGMELRRAGIDAPILVMGSLFPEQAEALAALRLASVVFTMDTARALSRAAQQLKTTVSVHVKIDTGMGRIGIAPEQALEFVRLLRGLPGIDVQGLMTHFADADLREKEFASKQMDRFDVLVRSLSESGIPVPLIHAANSAAVLDYQRALFTMVRPGLMLYGYNPLEAGAAHADLLPVLSLVTRIAFLKKVAAGIPISYGRSFVTQRESLIATLPIGYADGFSRGLSNKGEALVRGRRVPVVGRVCMDMCLVDVTEVPDVAEGDDVVLIGRQGRELITAEEIAAKIGTIPYEVLCGISSRVPRIYL
ncbi:MAG TPA: alanine racemase [Nitrospirota bacterium]|nr:alanine racemase [Nitrospirota bacterium]